MSEATLSAILLTLKVASISTLTIVIPGTLLAYFFARSDTAFSRIIFTLTGLPLVLPPTAVGFLLLRLIAVDGPFGHQILGFNINLILTWQAAVIAAGIMSLPIVVRTAKVAFENVDPRLEDISRTLGYGAIRTFLSTTLPLASRGLIASVILGFTRAVGEFGATVTVAGNIPLKTQTLSAAIFSAQQVGNTNEAYALIAVSLFLGFLAIFSTELLISRQRATLNKS